MAEATCVPLLAKLYQQFAAIRTTLIPEAREEVLKSGRVGRPRVHQPALGQDLQPQPLGNGTPAQSSFFNNLVQVHASLMQLLNSPELLQAYVASTDTKSSGGALVAASRRFAAWNYYCGRLSMVGHCNSAAVRSPDAGSGSSGSDRRLAACPRQHRAHPGHSETRGCSAKADAKTRQHCPHGGTQCDSRLMISTTRCRPTGATMPNSAEWLRSALISMVCCRTSRSRTAVSHSETFLCADLGITPEVPSDREARIASWLIAM